MEDSTKLLSSNEINEPRIVLNEFFNKYEIMHLRCLIKMSFNYCIKEKDEIMRERFKLFQNQIIKVLEASWLIDKKSPAYIKYNYQKKTKKSLNLKNTTSKFP